MVGNVPNTKYVNIKLGKMSVYNGKGKPPTEHDFLSGTINTIGIVEEEYKGNVSEKIIVNIRDNENYKLKFDLNSGYGRMFCQQLPNVNPSKAVTFQGKYEEKDGRKSSSLFLSQDNKSVGFAHTAKNPNGLPEAKKVKVNGKEVLDRTDQMEFFKKIISTFQGKLSQSNNSISEETKDDLPF